MEKKKKNKFKIFMIVYPCVWIAVTAVVLVYLYGLLTDYEASEPNNVMDGIIGEFTADNIGTLLENYGEPLSEFEEVGVMAQQLEEKLDGEVTYKRKSGEFTQNTPVYSIVCGDEIIAKCTLKEKKKNSHGFTEWELDTISFDNVKFETREIKIEAPVGAEVYINGKAVSADYAAGEDEVDILTKNLSQFSQTAYVRTYTVQNLLSEVEVSAKISGSDVVVTNDGDEYTVSYPSDDELLESQRERIQSFLRNYGMYIIKMGDLTKLLSFTRGTAYDYLSDIPAVWAYLWGETFTYEFRNESITNMQKISDSCFAVDGYFDLYVNYVKDDITYPTAMTCIFIKEDDVWYVADLILHRTDDTSGDE